MTVPVLNLKHLKHKYLSTTAYLGIIVIAGLLIFHFSKNTQTPDTLFEVGMQAYQQRNYSASESNWKRAISLYQVDDPKDYQFIRISSWLGFLLQEQGKYKQALEPTTSALLISSRLYGNNCLTTAKLLSNKADLHVKLGQYDVACPLYRKALQVRKSILGPSHPITLQTRRNLAECYSDNGQYKKSEDTCKQILNSSSDNPDTAMTLNCLARSYFLQKRFSEAESVFKKALTISSTTFGSEHPNTVLILNNLANSYVAQQKYIHAERILRTALTITTKNYGVSHPNTALVMNNLANCLTNSHMKLEEAESLYKECIHIRETKLGMHPETATALNNLAFYYKSLQRNKDAKELYSRASQIAKATLGANHPNTKIIAANRSHLY